MRACVPLFVAAALLSLEQPEPARTVRGQVVAEGNPVDDARVRFKGVRDFGLTDKNGRFELRGPGERITAWKEGFFIAGGVVRDRPVHLRLRPLPREDNPDYEWVHPGPSATEEHACGNCHGQIHDEWASSSHGRSGRNKHFINLHDGTDWHGTPGRGWNLRKDHPNGAGVCAACHAPTVPFDDPGFDNPRKLSGVHAQGVHCDYCHKIADAPIDKLGLEHGRYAYRLLRPKTGQLFFGPLDDVDRDEDAYAPLYHESRYCASCHEGTLFGTRVYTTYSEWLDSPARKQGKQCQTCHLAPTGKMTNIAPGRGGIERDPRTLASHQMIGASQEMLRRCLHVDVTLRRKKDTLEVELELIARDVGHRVPTGFIDRHLLLIVEPLGGKHPRPDLLEGPQLGKVAGDTLAGHSGKHFGRSLEDADGRSPVPFWLPNREKADTRLHPEKPERVRWRFRAPDAREVRVRLIYRRFHEAVARAKAWPDNEIPVIDKHIPIPTDGQTRFSHPLPTHAEERELHNENALRVGRLTFLVWVEPGKETGESAAPAESSILGGSSADSSLGILPEDSECAGTVLESAERLAKRSKRKARKLSKPGTPEPDPVQSLPPAVREMLDRFQRRSEARAGLQDKE